jgi:ankyrin repeat protein
MSVMPAGHTAGDDALTVAENLRSQGPQWDIFGAAALGESERITDLLHDDPTFARATRMDGKTPLHLAAQGGHQTAMERLLAHGADPNARDAAGRTPLHHAAHRGHPEAARVLLEHGADVTARDGRGRPPLYLAAHDWATPKRRPSHAVVDLLLAYGAPFDLFAAAVLGRVERASELLDAEPALLNVHDEGGYTPLHLAVWNGKLEMAKRLLARGAEMDGVNERGETPLAPGCILENHNADVIHLLLAADLARLHSLGDAARLMLYTATQPTRSPDPIRRQTAPVRSSPASRTGDRSSPLGWDWRSTHRPRARPLPVGGRTPRRDAPGERRWSSRRAGCGLSARGSGRPGPPPGPARGVRCPAGASCSPAPPAPPR